MKKNGGSSAASLGSGFMGAAPPQYFVASSVPFLPLNVSTVPISLTGNGASAASSREDLEDLVARIMDRQNSRAAAAAAAGDADMSCKDPCGDIKQLQNDVREMKQITANLSLAVEQLVKERAGKQ